MSFDEIFVLRSQECILVFIVTLFRVLVKHVESNGIFNVLDESYPALEIELCPRVALGRFAGKPWKRARTIILREWQVWCSPRGKLTQILQVGKEKSGEKTR